MNQIRVASRLTRAHLRRRCPCPRYRGRRCTRRGRFRAQTDSDVALSILPWGYG